MPALINLLERPKMTRTMYEALKRHIINERAKIKQEQEQDAQIERMRKEREQRKKKEEEEALTLEQTKEQISTLDKRLEQLNGDKSQLFLQLKKVLNQEEETRRRAQIKENSEMLSLQQQAYSQHGLGSSGHPVMLQASRLSSRPTLYKPVQMPQQTPVKRPRSPSPPPSSTYQSGYHGDSKYPYTPGKPGPTSHLYPQHAQSSEFKMGSYPPAPGSQTGGYGSQTNHSYVPQQAPPPVSATAFQGQGQGQPGGGGGKYSGGSSAFSSYPPHYSGHPPPPPPPGKTEGFPSSYGLQRMAQPGFHASQHSASLQHQLEQAQKSGFQDDKYKQQPARRGLPSGQQGALMSQTIMQQQQSKGSIVTGIPGQPASTYQPAATSNTYQNQQSGSGRPNYPNQPHRQYYQGH